MNHRLVFAHGTGRAGPAAWPEQTKLPVDCAFVTLPGYGDDSPRRTNMDAWVDTLYAASQQPVHLIAYSYGAIPAVLAAGQAPGWCRSLLLFEPATYSLARGRRSVEAHIQRLSPVLHDAASIDTATFWARYLTALTGSPAPLALTSQERVTAERFRLLTPPWSHQLPPAVFATVPTLVVSGDWNAEYEEVAEALVTLGAHHRILRGCGLASLTIPAPTSWSLAGPAPTTKGPATK
ncbi:MAG: alpha/beta hydrolase [Dermatophilaceae bacterium]